MNKVDIFDYKHNIVAWHNLHSVRKVIRINATQVLDIFHDAIDNNLKITIESIKKYQNDDSLDLTQTSCHSELLPNGTKILHSIYSDRYFACALLDSGHYVVASWETDDVLIF